MLSPRGSETALKYLLWKLVAKAAVEGLASDLM